MRSLVGLGLSVLSLLVTIWIVAPGPVPGIWMVALGASEWSLAFGAVGLLGAVLCGTGRGRPWARRAGMLLGAASILLSLHPLIDAHRVARTVGASLSLREYVLGGGPPRARVETKVFATVSGQALRADLYSPDGPGPHPAVIVLHTGSWSGGERSEVPAWDHLLAAEGMVVADIDYRLAPQPNFPQAPGDVKCAVVWLKANARRLRVDPARIALLGRSAGGHLALLSAYTAGDGRVPPTCPGDERVRAVVSFYAYTDLRAGYEHPANQATYDGRARLRGFLGGDPSTASAAYALASPITHLRAGAPPTLLFHGGRDQVIAADQMERLAGRLAALSVQNEVVRLPYAQHAFDFNAHGPGAQVARPVLLRFLKKHLF